MLPIRWIFPIVAALFVISIAPLAFNTNTGAIQYKTNELKSLLGLPGTSVHGKDAPVVDRLASIEPEGNDVTGTAQPMAPLAPVDVGASGALEFPVSAARD